jgi:hypothetical protein
MDHIGIDVHKKESQICILADGGELIERRIRTEPARFERAISQWGSLCHHVESGVSRFIPSMRLKWKAIAVAHELSKSPNAKIIVVGDKSGLPIILSEK